MRDVFINGFIFKETHYSLFLDLDSDTSFILSGSDKEKRLLSFDACTNILYQDNQRIGRINIYTRDNTECLKYCFNNGVEIETNVGFLTHDCYFKVELEIMKFILERMENTNSDFDSICKELGKFKK